MACQEPSGHFDSINGLCPSEVQFRAQHLTQALQRSSVEDREMADSKGFTRRLLDQLPPPKRERWITDYTLGRGGGRLLMRLHPSGTKNFYFRYFINGEAHLIPMGPYSGSSLTGYLTLEAAREKAREYSALYRDPRTRDVRLAVLPQGSSSVVALGPQSSEASRESRTLLALCNAYIAHLDRMGRNASMCGMRNHTKLYIATSPWALQPANCLTMEGATDLLRVIVERGLRRTPAKVRALLHAAYALALRARSDPSVPKRLLDFNISSNPLAGTSSLNHMSVPRTRALTATELGHLWHALTNDTKAAEIGYRLTRLGLLLGGQRVAQLHACLRANVDLEAETLLLHDSKGRRSTPREHYLPLSPGALTEVRWLMEVSRSMDSLYLIPGTKPDRPMLHGTELHVIEALCKRLTLEGKCNEHFHHQDLRRTATTRMAELGISKDVRCQIQSHGLGDIESRHYDRYEYLAEKRDALIKWEAYLTKLAEAASQAKSSSSISER